MTQKDRIIISILNKLGIGVNAYVPKNTAILVNMMRKLLPDMSVTYESGDNTLTIIIDNELALEYTKTGSRVTDLKLRSVNND